MKFSTLNPTNTIEPQDIGSEILLEKLLERYNEAISLHAKKEIEPAKELYKSLISEAEETAKTSRNSQLPSFLYRLFLNYARILKDEGEIEDSLFYCLKATEHDNSDPTLYHTIGTLFVSIRNLKQAITSFKEGLKLSKTITTKWSCLTDLIECLYNSGDFKQCVEYIDEALKLSSGRFPRGLWIKQQILNESPYISSRYHLDFTTPNEQKIKLEKEKRVLEKLKDSEKFPREIAQSGAVEAPIETREIDVNASTWTELGNFLEELFNEIREDVSSEIRFNTNIKFKFASNSLEQMPMYPETVPESPILMDTETDENGAAANIEGEPGSSDPFIEDDVATNKMRESEPVVATETTGHEPESDPFIEVDTRKGKKRNADAIRVRNSKRFRSQSPTSNRLLFRSIFQDLRHWFPEDFDFFTGCIAPNREDSRKIIEKYLEDFHLKLSNAMESKPSSTPTSPEFESLDVSSELVLDGVDMVAIVSFLDYTATSDCNIAEIGVNYIKETFRYIKEDRIVVGDWIVKLILNLCHVVGVDGVINSLCEGEERFETLLCLAELLFAFLSNSVIKLDYVLYTTTKTSLFFKVWSQLVLNFSNVAETSGNLLLRIRFNFVCGITESLLDRVGRASVYLVKCRKLLGDCESGVVEITLPPKKLELTVPYITQQLNLLKVRKYVMESEEQYEKGEYEVVVQRLGEVFLKHVDSYDDSDTATIGNVDGVDEICLKSMRAEDFFPDVWKRFSMAEFLCQASRKLKNTEVQLCCLVYQFNEAVAQLTHDRQFNRTLSKIVECISGIHTSLGENTKPNVPPTDSALDTSDPAFPNFSDVTNRFSRFFSLLSQYRGTQKTSSLNLAEEFANKLYLMLPCVYTLMYEKDFKITIFRPTGAIEKDKTSRRNSEHKVEVFTLKFWTVLLLYLQFKYNDGSNNENVETPNGEDQSTDTQIKYSPIGDLMMFAHEKFGQVKICLCDGGLFLKLVGEQFKKDNNEPSLYQIYHCLYGVYIMLDSETKIQSHDTTPQPLSTVSAGEIFNTVYEFLEKKFLKKNLKVIPVEVKEIMEMVEGVFPGCDFNRLDIVRNREIINRYFASEIDLDTLFGLNILPITDLSQKTKANINDVYFKLYRLQGRTKFTQFKNRTSITKRRTPEILDEVIEDFLKNLYLNPTDPFAWELIAQTYMLYSYEYMIWSALDISENFGKIRRLQKNAFQAFMQSYKLTPDPETLSYTFWSDFGFLAHAIVSSPMSGAVLRNKSIRVLNIWKLRSRNEPETQLLSLQPPRDDVNEEENGNDDDGDTVKRLTQLSPEETKKIDLDMRRMLKFSEWCFQKAMECDPDDWVAVYTVGKLKLKLGNPVRLVLKYLVKSIKMVPKEWPTKDQENILDPHIKLLSVLAKSLYRDEIEPKTVSRVLLQVFPNSVVFGGENQEEESVDKPTLFKRILNVIKYVKAKDKKKWQHKHYYLSAWIQKTVFNDLDSSFAEIIQLIHPKPIGIRNLVNFWRPEFERLGKHFSYVNKYLAYIIELLGEMKDVESMRTIVRKLKTSDDILLWPDRIRKLADDTYFNILSSLVSTTDCQTLCRKYTRSQFDSIYPTVEQNMFQLPPSTGFLNTASLNGSKPTDSSTSDPTVILTTLFQRITEFRKESDGELEEKTSELLVNTYASLFLRYVEKMGSDLVVGGTSFGMELPLALVLKRAGIAKPKAEKKVVEKESVEVVETSGVAERLVESEKEIVEAVEKEVGDEDGESANNTIEETMEQERADDEEEVLDEEPEKDNMENQATQGDEEDPDESSDVEMENAV
ncbi:Histone transcription regulator 3 [Nowakowskiella sp. JEL0407]|nr:Histone transcription regulator 3 [Nowakowskiella sp. JEL0407]